MVKYKNPSFWAKAEKKIARFLQIPIQIKDSISDPISTAISYVVDKLAEKDTSRKSLGMQRNRCQTFDNDKGHFLVYNTATGEVIREGSRQPYKNVRIKKQKSNFIEKPISQKNKGKSPQARQYTSEEKENKKSRRKQENSHPRRLRTQGKREKNKDKRSRSREETRSGKESRRIYDR